MSCQRSLRLRCGYTKDALMVNVVTELVRVGALCELLYIDY